MSYSDALNVFIGEKVVVGLSTDRTVTGILRRVTSTDIDVEVSDEWFKGTRTVQLCHVVDVSLKVTKTKEG